MFRMLFTVTFFIGIVILLRCVCKNYISARVQYAIWLLVAVKLLIFPMPNMEGNFSVLGLVPEVESRMLSEETAEETERSDYADGVQQSGASVEGNLWGQGSSTVAGETVGGADTNVQAAHGETAGKGRTLSKWEAWRQRTGLRLQYYIKNTLKIPQWLAGILASGSILCALGMVGYHVRLNRYLQKKSVKLTGDQAEETDEEKLTGDQLGKTGEEKITAENLVGKFVAEERNVLPIYSVEELPTPCLFGRRIYIPAKLAEDRELLSYALQHEMCHYIHGDSLWGFVRMVCICLYWYHPLVWLAAYLSRQDCELACDEAVVKRMTGQERKCYGELLLEFALVKGSPADCFSMTTAMSGNARNLKQRLERIAGKKKNWVLLTALALALATAGICACVTSGFVSPDKQLQYIQIKEQEGSMPLRESYDISYRLSEDVASYGFYMEQYEYGELVSVYAGDCMTRKAGRSAKKGEAVLARTVESDNETGAFTKIACSYSIQDDGGEDGATSMFKAFTLELPEKCAGNSFSFNTGKKISCSFRMDEDIILLADYYGEGEGVEMPDGTTAYGYLSVPAEHIFAAEKYMEDVETGEILKRDRCIILVHLIVSDKSAGELEKELEEIIRSKEAGISGENPGEDIKEAGTESAAVNTGGYSNEELLEMARNYYRQEHGFAPFHVEIDSENDEQVVIWLYDMDEYLNARNEITGNAVTRDWYTVDRMTGKGENVLFEEIDLTQTASLTRPWGGKIEEMTVTDVREPEAFFALSADPETGAENRLYLLGETVNYKLYGAGDYRSMILEEQDSVTEITVPFIADGITLMTPGVQEADYDGDGMAELAVKLLCGEGTGVWQEQLWVLDREAGQMKAHEYHSGDFSGQLLSELEWEQEDGRKRILLDDQPISPILREEGGVSYEGLGIDTSRVSFAFQDGKIRLRTLISCGSRKDSVMPAYGNAVLEAEVSYYGNGAFFLSDIETADMENMKTAAQEAVREIYAPRQIEFIDTVYHMEAWRFSDDIETMKMTLTILENGMDSYDFAEVPLMRDETGQWSVGEILIEK